MTETLGLNNDSRTEIASSLTKVLAESVQLYVLSWNVHWNVTGPLFASVHALTEEHYLELATAVDDIAERIRALGEKAPAGLGAYQSLGAIADGDENASAEDMVKSLIAGHEQVIKTIRPIAGKAADAGDEVTAGIMADRLTVHEKAHWMLSALVA